MEVLLSTDDSEVALELADRLDVLERGDEAETKRVGWEPLPFSSRTTCE